jgi:hypothetical protein
MWHVVIFWRNSTDNIKKQLYPKKSYNNGKFWKGTLKHIYIPALASKYLTIICGEHDKFQTNSATQNIGTSTDLPSWIKYQEIYFTESSYSAAFYPS